MKLTRIDYQKLYDEVIDFNEENIQGHFFVSNEAELQEQALSYLKSEYEYDDDDLAEIELLISWKGKGLYAFHALGLIKEYSLHSILDIFLMEISINPFVYLGDRKAIEEEKFNFNDAPYAYAVFKVNIQYFTSDLVSIVYSDYELSVEEVFDELEDNEGNGHENGPWYNHDVAEIMGMGNEEFYSFLKAYNRMNY